MEMFFRRAQAAMGRVLLSFDQSFFPGGFTD